MEGVYRCGAVAVLNASIFELVFDMLSWLFIYQLGLVCFGLTEVE